MTNNGPKIQREKDTVEKMIRFFCRSNHDKSETELCVECDSLLSYAHKRLDYCQFGEDKPSCRKCPIHCYNPERREMIRRVMRYSGPRLVIKAPLTWIRHWFDERENK